MIREIFNGSPSTPPTNCRLHWSRIALFAALLVALGAVVASTTLWLYFVNVRRLDTVRYVDTLTPEGWRKIRSAMGDRAIAEADAAVAANDIGSAVRLYRIGIAKSPRNSSGRIALSQIYVAVRRPDLARDLLIGGLTFLSDNPKYLQATFDFLLEFQFDVELRAASAQLLAHPSVVVRRQAALYAAAVAFHAGNFDETENLLAAHRLTGDPAGALLLGRADFERGFPELALARLAPALNDPSTHGAALRVATEIHERRGRLPDLARNAALRLADDPLSASPRLAVLRQLHAQHRTADLAREIETFLRLFAHDESALLALGDFAAETGQPNLVRRLQELFAQNNWSPDAPELLYAEACLTGGRPGEALLTIDRYARENTVLAARYAPACSGLRTVALFALQRDDDAELQLAHLLAQPNLRAENLHAVATRLRALGRPHAARLVLERASDLDPRNQSALTALVRLEAELDHFDPLRAHVRRLLAMRRPSREVLEFVYRRLGSDLHLLDPEQQSLLAEIRQHLASPAALASVARP